jgi:hypothetical protein
MGRTFLPEQVMGASSLKTEGTKDDPLYKVHLTPSCFDLPLTSVVRVIRTGSYPSALSSPVRLVVTQFRTPSRSLIAANWFWKVAIGTGSLSVRTEPSAQQFLHVSARSVHHLAPLLTAIQARLLLSKHWNPHRPVASTAARSGTSHRSPPAASIIIFLRFLLATGLHRLL